MLAGPREERFESLDVLRGVAVLGILAINMQAMAQPASIFENPSLLGASFGESGHWWAIASTFFQFKFITIFSALFGAGIILMVGEEKPSGGRVAIHYRRMFWLLLFGLTHAFAIWFGDILTPYALAGFIVVLARRWSPRRLIVVGMLLISILGLAILAQAVMLPHMPPEEAEKIFADMLATPEQVQAEIAALKGAWPMRIADTWETPLQFQLIQGLALLPRNIGVMMIGMALYKMGFFTLRWSTLSYLIAAAICLPIGIYGSAWATAQYQVHNFEMLHLMPGQAALYWASLPQSFAYAAIVMLIAKLVPASIITKPFAAAGRMALTNYIGCSFVGFFMFYGLPGLGMIGEFDLAQQAMTVGIVWVAILIISPLWLGVFRYGPLEWFWRTLTYWSPQKLRR